jgi:hypothetical protein
VAQKLIALKAYQKTWNEVELGNLEKNKRALLDDLKGLNEIEEQRTTF